jgi:hypothetical protein
MVSVPKFPPIPRLSIVIPIGHDVAAFESTLISVLENRPAGCEILVAHDGNYADPFDLCDEVRFVTAPSDRFADLVSTSAAIALGRFVHVIADGLRATAGWVDHALEQFEHDEAGVVIPVIRRSDEGKILAAGWHDGARLCQPSASGQQQVDGRSATATGGCYLQASFWRRDLLRSLRGTLESLPEGVEASYAVGHLVRSAGWRNVVCHDSTLLCDSDSLPWEFSSWRRGQRLRAIESYFSTRKKNALGCAVKAWLVGALRASTYTEALGQALAPLAVREVSDKLQQATPVRRDDDREVIVKVPALGTKQVRHAA